MTARYDTLVIKNTKSERPPMQVDGAEVSAWFRGHALRQLNILEGFVDDLASGMYSIAPEELELKAGKILARSRAARDTTKA